MVGRRLLEKSLEHDWRMLINVLIGFCVLAVSASALALLPSALTGAILGGLLMATGIGIVLLRRPQWGVLANICISSRHSCWAPGSSCSVRAS
jgi:hypothetical protein